MGWNSAPVAVTTAAAVTAAIAAATVAATVAATISAAIAAAAAVTAAAAAAATASRTFFAGSSFVDRDRTAANFLTVQRVDRLVSVLLFGHFHKRETPGPARFAIHDDVNRRNVTKLFESPSHVSFGSRPSEVSHINIRH